MLGSSLLSRDLQRCPRCSARLAVAFQTDYEEVIYLEISCFECGHKVHEYGNCKALVNFYDSVLDNASELVQSTASEDDRRAKRSEADRNSTYDLWSQE